jgi:hypothetical protein
MVLGNYMHRERWLIPVLGDSLFFTKRIDGGKGEEAYRILINGSQKLEFVEIWYLVARFLRIDN